VTDTHQRPGDAPDLPRPRGAADDVPPEHGGTEGTQDVRVDRLEKRLARLEWLVRGDMRSELDHLEPPLAASAQAAERAHDLASGLIAPHVRAACEQAISAWREWCHQHAEVVAATLEASRMIAVTGPDSPVHERAAAEFRTRRSELTMLLTSKQGLLNAANHADRQLDNDRQVRERCRPEIEAGHEAWDALNRRLRLRVTIAVRDGDPLPAWLVVAIGPPPSDELGEWRELAADLLAYRITYGVRDRMEALGPEPGADHSPRRRHWYAVLHWRLVRWLDRSGTT
jgi:hypothetical protein